jgi:methionine biosynthesis protein MetW
MSPDTRMITPLSVELREDLRLVASMIDSGSRVLDLGCGDGELLSFLVHNKGVDGRGMELSQGGVNACVRNGLSVIQGDADNDLRDYPSRAFDYVVLSQTLQATRNPHEVLRHLVRIGRHAIVSIPNFGHWRMRLRILLEGRMPRTPVLPHHWYDTPNIHLCTILDFVDLCDAEEITVERSVTLDAQGRAYRLNPRGRLANLLAAQGLFMLAGRNGQ